MQSVLEFQIMLVLFLLSSALGLDEPNAFDMPLIVPIDSSDFDTPQEIDTQTETTTEASPSVYTTTQLLVNETNATKCLDEHQIMDYILKRYNRNKLPAVVDGVPVVVNIEVWIQRIFEVSEQTRDFSLTVYMTEQWTDPRLVFAHANPCKMNMSLKDDYIKKLWVPNLTFINTKMAEFHVSPFTNMWLLIDSDGGLWMNYRMNLTAPCQTDYTLFPMDARSCVITFESYNHHRGEVAMQWHPASGFTYLTDDAVAGKPWQRGSSDSSRTATINEVTVFGYHLVSLTNDTFAKEYAAGYWDELSLIFVFKRRYGWYLIQVYVPSYITVFTSWVSFSFGPKAVPARSMLGVNALLALTFQFETIMKSLPRVSYVKAIDVWMIGCSLFVFATMIELSIVGNIKLDAAYHSNEGSIDETQPTLSVPMIPQRRMSEQELSDFADTSLHVDTSIFDRTTAGSLASIPSLPSLAVNVVPVESNIHVKSQSVRLLNRLLCRIECAWTCGRINPFFVDNVSILLFPTLFAAFNIAYWTYYGLKGINM